MSGARWVPNAARRVELADRIRAKVALELTLQQTCESLGLTRGAVVNLCTEFGIKFGVTGLRLRGKVKHRLDDEGLIEAAITKLRRGKYAPVCAMYTIRRPAMIPQPYHYGMTFRVGTERNVPLARLFEMADALP